ncbi:MAG: hypothetical protein II336_08920 [Loktanella sp.]|nr:hypothetical protein [Loktanella sp.]
MTSDHYASASEQEADKTRPPLTGLRFHSPSQLYSTMPALPQMTQLRPHENEAGLEFLYRLRGSTTPEEAVTFSAFAAMPKMAVWWGYECLRQSVETFSPQDRAVMEMIAVWTSYPDDANRFRIMQTALYAPVRSPAVYMGLAVGWSGGGIAPNDPTPVPAHRTPRAINTAILSSLARLDLNKRSVWLARFIDLAVPLFRPY